MTIFDTICRRIGSQSSFESVVFRIKIEKRRRYLVRIVERTNSTLFRLGGKNFNPLCTRILVSITKISVHPRKIPPSDGNARPINQMTRNIKGPIEFPGKTWTRPHKRGETWRSPNHRVHLSRIIEWSKLILCSCVCVCVFRLSLSLSLSRSPSPFASFSFNVNFNRAQLIDVYRPKKCIRWRLNEFRSFFFFFLSFSFLSFLFPPPPSFTVNTSWERGKRAQRGI